MTFPSINTRAKQRRLTVKSRSMSRGTSRPCSLTQCPYAGHSLHNHAWQPRTLTMPQRCHVFSWIWNIYQPRPSLALLQPFAGLLHTHLLGVSLTSLSWVAAWIRCLFRCPHLTTWNWIAIASFLDLPCALGAPRGHWTCCSFFSALHRAGHRMDTSYMFVARWRGVGGEKERRKWKVDKKRQRKGR